MQLIRDILRRYPWQCAAMVFVLVLAGGAEGLSLGSLLPMLSLAAAQGPGTGAGPAGDAMGFVGAWFEAAGMTPTLGALLGLIVLGVTVKGLLMLLAQSLVGYTAANFAADLRLQMLRAVLGSRLDYFLHQPLGKLSNALATEAQSTSSSFVNAVNALTFLIQALIYATVAVAISWRATVAGLCAGVLVVGACGVLVRIARKAGRNQTARLRTLSAQLSDVLLSVRPLKAMAQERLAEAVLVAENARLVRAQRRQVLSAATLSSAQEELFAIAIALGMFVAISRLQMPFPTVMVLVLTLGRMLAQLGKVQKEYQKVAIGEGAYLSLRNTIAQARAAEEPAGGHLQPALHSGICLESVRFAYGARPVFTNLSLALAAGSFTTLMGPSGSGKSTILDLILGFAQPLAGRVTVDGVALQELDTRAWRRMIGYVPQETLLLHDTIMHNVTLGDPAFAWHDVRRALQMAGVWELVCTLPEGMNHVVGERGGKLSGGQRQRIMIARALVRQPRLLILDEATSSLDEESEAGICATLEGLRGTLTILAISHRPAFAQVSERVIHVEQLDTRLHTVAGRSSESGKSPRNSLRPAC